MAYLRNKKDYETGFLLNRSLSFKAYKRTSPLFSFKTVQKNIPFAFKATAYVGDKGKMHCICSTP